MGQLPNCKFMAFDANGDPLSGGKVHTYEAGTTTNKATYSDSGLTSANANPVVLNSRGEADIYGSGLYKIVLKDSDDVTVWTVDNFRGTSLSSIGDTDDDTKIQMEESSDEDIMRFDINGTEQITLQDGKLEPTTDNDIDLGASGKGFKNLYVSGEGDIETLSGSDIRFRERVTAPTTLANKIALYAKAVTGQSEIFFREESNGDEVQLTDGGRTALPRGHIDGLQLSNDTDTEHDIAIAVGAARDSTDAVNLALAAIITRLYIFS
jgi:hypothetical protein